MTIIHCERDIAYTTILNPSGPRPLLLDMHYPDPHADRIRPALVMIHGGAWSSNDRAHIEANAAAAARAGLVVANIQYRLSGEAAFPDPLDDCRAALRWLCRHAARYGADPARIGVWGESAGGHYAALLALTASPLDGPAAYPWRAIVLNPVTSLLGDAEGIDPETLAPVLQLMGGKLPHEAPELYRAASPLAHVSPHAPPFLLIHGDADPVVPYAQSVALHEALAAQQVPVRLITIPGGGHGQDFPGGDPASVAAAYDAAWRFALGTDA